MSDTASQDATPRARRRLTADERHQRGKTRHNGIRTRKRADGGTSYLAANGQEGYVTFRTEREAIAFRAQVLARQARGEQITLPTKLRFRDAAEQWFEVARHELRPAWRASTGACSTT